MNLVEGLWSGLPLEIVERVLCFLPVTELCRLRAVCKRWDALIGSRSFHELCARRSSGREGEEREAYVLVTRNMFVTWCVSSEGWSLLDLRERRWYTLGDEFLQCLDGMEDFCERRTLAADGGLVCVLYAGSRRGQDDIMVVCNPVAKTAKKLPPLRLFSTFDCDPVVVMAVDAVSRSYKIFVINDLSWRDLALPRMHVYESSTQRWRSLRNPPVGLEASSSVLFRGLLYTLFNVTDDEVHSLLTYNVCEDQWSEVDVCVPEELRIPQLVVSDGRLFMMAGWDASDRDNASAADAAAYAIAAACQTSPPGSRLEILEILAAKKACVPVVQMPNALLEKLWSKYEPYWSDLDDAVGYNSHILAVGLRSAIFFISSSLVPVAYDVTRSSWDPLPANPGRHHLSNRNGEEEGFYGSRMSLSLSTVL